MRLVACGFILILIGLAAIIFTTYETLRKLNELDLAQVNAWKELAVSTMLFAWVNIVFVFVILLGILLIDLDLMRRKSQ